MSDSTKRAPRKGIVAGVDSSTQSCTVELRDLAGTLLGRGRAAHPPTQPPVSEQPVKAWWDALRIALTEACKEAGVKPGAIDAISVAAQCHGLVVLDQEGNALIPVKLWNDTTSAPQVDQLLNQLAPAEWAQRTGFVPNAALTVAKLAKLAVTDPGTLARVAHLMVPHDWINYQLTGNFTTDRSDASGTGYFDAASNQWRLDLIELAAPGFELSAALPKVLQPQQPAGRVRAEAAATLGLRQRILAGPGAGDQHASALGLGIRPGDLVYVFGTSGVVYTSSHNAVVDPSGMVDSVANAAGGFLPLVCTLNAAKVTDTFMRILDADPSEFSELALAALNARASDNGPASLPTLVAYLDGERSPMRPDATGMLAGLTSSTTRAEIALSAIEGVILGLRQGEHRLAELGLDTSGRIIATGGGAASIAYRQVLAEHTGRNVLVLDATDATARGAAIQAATVLLNDRQSENAPLITVADIASQWAPPVLSETVPLAITPRPTVPDQLVAQYNTVAAWTGTDEPTQPSNARRPHDGQDN